jgi:hypothetical protein
MKYCNVPTLTQEEKKMEKNFKNVLDKILFVQNFLISLPMKNNKGIADKISEMNDEIKKEIREQLGLKFEKLYDDIINFTETVITGNIELKQKIEDLQTLLNLRHDKIEELQS